MNQERILIVEDNQIIASNLRLDLEDLGYGVVGQTASGEDAVCLAVEERPDLILMDISLQGSMDGIQASQAIREQIETAIVFLTSYGESVMVKRAKMLEPHGFLLKPYSGPQLQASIEVALYKALIDKERRAHAQERERLIAKLEKALSEVKTLRGFIAICASCKKIRNDQGFWQQMEQYVEENSEVLFSHGICPECARRLYPEYFLE
ncbi:MAG: response regulator [Deltaproteobacteria bacterium]|nr:response regulator [Deltaproteobacteria bacterium]